MGTSPNIVLVVEDERLIRMLAADLLVDAGFDVIETASADEALAALHTYSAHVAMLFTDVHMPGGMTGLELARIVRARWPRIAILVTSTQHKLVAGELPPGGRFLTKPYQAEHFMAHVQDLTSRLT